jgi:hypothetical protein
MSHLRLSRCVDHSQPAAQLRPARPLARPAKHAQQVLWCGDDVGRRVHGQWMGEVTWRAACAPVALPTGRASCILAHGQRRQRLHKARSTTYLELLHRHRGRQHLPSRGQQRQQLGQQRRGALGSQAVLGAGAGKAATSPGRAVGTLQCCRIAACACGRHVGPGPPTHVLSRRALEPSTHPRIREAQSHIRTRLGTGAQPTTQCTVRCAQACTSGWYAPPWLSSETSAHMAVTSRLVAAGAGGGDGRRASEPGGRKGGQGSACRAGTMACRAESLEEWRERVVVGEVRCATDRSESCLTARYGLPGPAATCAPNACSSRSTPGCTPAQGT